MPAKKPDFLPFLVNERSAVIDDQPKKEPPIM